MKAKVALSIGGTALGCMALVGCGGGGNNSVSSPAQATNPPVTTVQLDTYDVLSIAQTKTSETSQPFLVDGGAVAITPAGDETGEPITVDGT
jgi:hypothetical protein